MGRVEMLGDQSLTFDWHLQRKQAISVATFPLPDSLYSSLAYVSYQLAHHKQTDSHSTVMRVTECGNKDTSMTRLLMVYNCIHICFNYVSGSDAYGP